MSLTSSGSWGLEKYAQGVRKLEPKANKKHEQNFLSFAKLPVTAVFTPMLLSVLLFVGRTWSGKCWISSCNSIGQWKSQLVL